MSKPIIMMTKPATHDGVSRHKFTSFQDFCFRTAKCVLFSTLLNKVFMYD